MTRIAKAHVIALGLAIGAVGCAGTQTALQMEKASGGEVATVNPDFKVDNDLGEAGRELFVKKGCIGCHTVGIGRAAGPDLYGVVERRPVDWLKGFLKNTGEYLDTDPVAQGLLKQYRNTRMPNLRLTDQEIDAVIHYLQLRTNERRAGD
jgi:mono/diheme cytochrome c family protein